MISLDRKKLVRIESAVVEKLGADAATKVSYYTPDEFIEFLRSLPAPPPPPPKVERIKGYKVTCSVSALTEEEAKLRESMGLDAIAETLRRKLKP